MKLLKADTDTAQFVCNIQSAMSLIGFFFRLTGTNPVTPLTLDDVGRLRYRIRNTAFCDASFAYLHHYGDAQHGVLPNVSTASGAMEFGVWIPRSFGDDNVEFVEANDNAVFNIVFGANVAAQTSFMAELHAVEGEGVNSYNLRIMQYGYSHGGAGVFPCPISEDNILQAWISDIVGGETTLTGSGIDRVSWQLGNRSGEASIGAQSAYTNFKGRIETAQALIAKIAEGEGDITARLNDQIHLSVNTSASALTQVLLLSAMFNPEKMNITKRLYVHRIGKALELARTQGKVRKEEVLKVLGIPSGTPIGVG